MIVEGEAVACHCQAINAAPRMKRASARVSRGLSGARFRAGRSPRNQPRSPLSSTRPAALLLLALIAGAVASASPALAQSAAGDPFAVTSRGRPGPRGDRMTVVVRDSAPAPARADTAPVADTVAPKAPARRPATGAAAATPARPPAAAPARPAATTPRAAAATRTHRVEWGETWYGIARQYSVSAAELQAANPDVDPTKLQSGEVLRIPRGSGPPTRRTHRVEAGESLWGIARKYGVSAEAIRKANGLDSDRVRTGDTLVIPGGE
jgi:LysM repeat protein